MRRPRSARSAAWSFEKSALAARARQFSDPPRRKPYYGGCWECSGLHKRVALLQAQKEELHSLAASQRKEPRHLEQERSRLHANAELAQVDFALESCSRWCAADVTRMELEQLRTERRQLEEELAAWRSSPARLRSGRQAEAQHSAAREAWLSERRELEQELTRERARIAAFEDEVKARREQDLAEKSLRASAVQALREEALQHRALVSEADRELWSAEAALAAAKEKLRRGRPPSLLQADEERLAKAKASLSREQEERRVGAEDLREAAEDLERLRKELNSLTAENTSLRSGLQRTIEGLERIQRQTLAFDTVQAPLSFLRPQDWM